MTRTTPIDVVCVGEALWDVYEIDERNLRRFPGGDSVNVAVHLAREGLRAAVAAPVGRDRLGELLARVLAREGVDTRWLVRVPERTGVTFVGEGGRFLNYRSATLARKHVTSPMARARFVVLGPSAFLGSGGRALLAEAQRHRTPIVLDLNMRPALGIGLKEMRPALEAAEIVKASEDDLAHYGLAEKTIRAPVVLVTRGAGSATAFTREEGRIEVAARPVRRVVDAVGAGDAFLAGVLAARLRGGNWTSALRLGHRLASRVVRHVGAHRWTRNSFV